MFNLLVKQTLAVVGEEKPQLALFPKDAKEVLKEFYQEHDPSKVICCH